LIINAKPEPLIAIKDDTRKHHGMGRILAGGTKAKGYTLQKEKKNDTKMVKKHAQYSSVS
jgi:hypothetical protein